jgi:hypothetical protein
MRFDRLFLMLRNMDYTVKSGGVTTAANLGISDRLQKTDTLKIH